LRRAELWFPILYGFLAGLLFAHPSLIDSSRLPGCSCEDPVNEVWFLAFARSSLLSGHLPFQTNLIGFPSGFNAAGSASFPLLGLLGLPLTTAFGPVASYNALLRLGMFVSALSCWLVLRRVLVSRVAAGVGGMIYAFSPYMVHAAEFHMFLVWVPLPPVILYLLYRHLMLGVGHSGRTGAWLGVCIACQYLIDAEIAAAVALVAALVTALLWSTRLCGLAVRGALRPGGVIMLAAARRGVIMLSFAGVVATLLVAYPVWQYLYGAHHVTVVQPVENTGIPWLTTFLAATAPVFPDDLAGSVHNLASEVGPLSTRYEGLFAGSGYIGPVLILALVWIAVQSSQRRIVRAAGALLAVSWVLGLGPNLTTPTGGLSTRLPTAWILHEPVLRNLVAGRLTLYVWLAIAVLIGVAIDELQLTRVRPDSSRAVRGWSVAVAAALVGAVLAAPDRRIPTYRIGSLPNVSTQEMRRAIPRGAAVLTYPRAWFPDDQPMLWQAIDEMRFNLVGGYAKFPGTRIGASLTAPLLQPTAVQCWLSQAQFPESSWSHALPGGCPLKPMAMRPGVMRTFARVNHIDAVLVERVGVRPERVVSTVSAAFGPPSAVAGRFLAWQTSR